MILQLQEIVNSCFFSFLQFHISCKHPAKKDGRLAEAYFSTSTTPAIGALFLTDSMPFLHEAFDEYASLVAMISPLGALSLHLHFPAASVYISNFGVAGKSIPP